MPANGRATLQVFSHGNFALISLYGRVPSWRKWGNASISKRKHRSLRRVVKMREGWRGQRRKKKGREEIDTKEGNNPRNWSGQRFSLPREVIFSSSNEERASVTGSVVHRYSVHQDEKNDCFVLIPTLNIRAIISSLKKHRFSKKRTKM